MFAACCLGPAPWSKGPPDRAVVSLPPNEAVVPGGKRPHRCGIAREISSRAQLRDPRGSRAHQLDQVRVRVPQERRAIRVAPAVRRLHYGGPRGAHTLERPIDLLCPEDQGHGGRAWGRVDLVNAPLCLAPPQSQHEPYELELHMLDRPLLGCRKDLPQPKKVPIGSERGLDIPMWRCTIGSRNLRRTSHQ